MPYAIAPHAGYCAGVRKAMETAFSAAREAQERGIYCSSLGELIHNPQAVAALREAGVLALERVEDAPGGIILLRSHGVDPQIIAACRERGLEIRDCTCSFVHVLLEIVRKSGLAGRPVILVGERLHPEVQGTAGWCSGPCYIVETEADVQALPPMEEALAVSQTTFPLRRWEELLALLKQKIPRLQIKCTICSATQKRLTEACALAARADAMVVVGGRASANTRKLFEACRAICPRTCLVERASEIPPRFANIHTEYIGIAAGASTPDWSFKEVVTRMNDMERIDQETQQEPAAANDSQALTMEDIEKTVVRIRNGQTVTGTVVQITDDEVCVNIGYKSDGLIKKSELVDQNVKLGDEIEVEVVKVNDGEGNVLLSQRNIVNRKAWDALMEKYEKGEYIDAVGKEAVKGGLLASVEGGVRAFVPASQLAQRYVEKIAQFVGQDMKLKIIDVDKQKKRIVASRKQVIEEESAAKKAAAWENLEEGAVVTGIVRRFADFGAFVDLGGVDGRIGLTDLTWLRVKNPSEVVSIGDTVEVTVKDIDRENNRVSLIYKKTEDNPWEKIKTMYKVGDVVTVKIMSITTFGAFAQIIPGIDGLIHISQIARERVEKVADKLSVGQEVEAKITELDYDRHRASLSIKALLAEEAPAEEAPAEEAPAEENEAPVEE